MTHDERLALIHLPLSIRYFPTSMPHGGTAVTDTFNRDANDPRVEWAERSHTDPNELNPWPVRFKGVSRGNTVGSYRFAELPERAWMKGKIIV